ncbi:hypothetical protein O3P69_005270 [Scylla paramamosain]|uniref:Sulfotransferase domain-containing protein n=1 Tax=Scylla paramamosain TaxID=85552 RepID=A0AAW0U7I8_SCYPA
MFYRNGMVGDWKKHFSPELQEMVDQWIQKNLNDSDLSPEVRRLAAEGSPSANWYCAATNDAKDTLMTTPRLFMTRLHSLRLGYHCLAELNDTLPITSHRHRLTHHAHERIPAPKVKEDTYQQLNNRTYTTSGPSLRQ